MRTGAVIAAAGLTSGKNGFDPMKKIGSISAAERIAATLSKAGIDETVFITGHNAHKLERLLVNADVVTLRNDQYAATGMLASVCIGLGYLESKCDRILIVPANIPMFTADTVRKLLDADAALARPLVHEKTGHPIVISSAIARKVLALPDARDLDTALRAVDAVPVDIALNDEGVLFDARREADAAAMREQHGSSLLRPVVRLALTKEVPFFDEKFAALLRLVNELHSVRAACQSIQISYSTGWNRIKELEEQLGCPLINRTQGGLIGGSRSDLTEVGVKMLALYEQFRKDVQQNTDLLYAKYFDDFLNRHVYFICAGEFENTDAPPVQRPLSAFGRLQACLLWRELSDKGIAAVFHASNAHCRETAQVIANDVRALSDRFDAPHGVADASGSGVIAEIRAILSRQNGNIAIVADADAFMRLYAELTGEAYPYEAVPSGSYAVLSLDGELHMEKIGIRPTPPLGRILCTKMLHTAQVGDLGVKRLIRRAEQTVNEAFYRNEDTENLECAVLLAHITLSDNGKEEPAPLWLRRLGYHDVADKVDELYARGQGA